MTQRDHPMRHWSETSLGRLRACEATFGPYLLAAYGQHRRYCWEVSLRDRRRSTVAEGVASTLTDARAAAEAAATHLLASAPPGAARGLPPAPQTRH